MSPPIAIVLPCYGYQESLDRVLDELAEQRRLGRGRAERVAHRASRRRVLHGQCGLLRACFQKRGVNTEKGRPTFLETQHK